MPPDGVLFIAVPDGAVAATASRLAAMRPPKALAVVHLSGALGLGALEPLRAVNPVGSFHPLQSFPFPRPPEAFRGVTVAVDGSSPALRQRLAALARKVGARPKHVDDSQRVLYHAAAVFASNFVDAAFAEGARLLEAIGWSERESVAALLPLLDGAVANMHARGPVKAMTGPIRRGDAETVRRHVEALTELERPLRRPSAGTSPRGGEVDVATADLYRMLGLVALRIATEAGLDPAAAERTREALTNKRALTPRAAATRRRRSP